MTKSERLFRLASWCGASAFAAGAFEQMASTPYYGNLDYPLIIGIGLGGFVLGLCAGLGLYALDERRTSRRSQHLGQIVNQIGRWERTKSEVA